MCRCKKVVFSPSFSCSAWSASRAASQITPNKKYRREILTLHCCPECFAQQVPQNGFWSKSAPVTMRKRLLLESYSAILAGLLLLLLQQQATRKRSIHLGCRHPRGRGCLNRRWPEGCCRGHPGTVSAAVSHSDPAAQFQSAPLAPTCDQLGCPYLRYCPFLCPCLCLLSSL